MTNHENNLAKLRLSASPSHGWDMQLRNPDGTWCDTGVKLDDEGRVVVTANNFSIETYAPAQAEPCASKEARLSQLAHDLQALRRRGLF